jgi:hypothetical protein
MFPSCAFFCFALANIAAYSSGVTVLILSEIKRNTRQTKLRNA